MKLKITFNKLNEIILMLSIFLIEFAVYTKNVNSVTNYSQIIINCALVIMFLFSIFKLIVIKVNIKKWIFFFSLIILASLSYIITKESLILQLCFIYTLSYNLDFKKIVKYDLIFRIFLLLFILANYELGNVNTLFFSRGGEIRYSFGFNQPNVFGIYLVAMYFEYMYLNNSLKKTFRKIALFLVALFLLNLAKSRASEMILILFCFIYFIDSLIKKKKINKDINKSKYKKYFIATFIIFILLTIISYLVTDDFQNGKNYALFLDDLFSKRLYIQWLYKNAYSITLFGNNINYLTSLDNAYMRVLLNYGFFTWIMYGFIYSFIITKAIRKKDRIIICIFIIFLVYGLVEWYILRPALNVFLLYCTTRCEKSILEECHNEK